MKAVDELDITILVDNATDNLSSAPRFVENEFAALGRRGLKLSGKCLCCAAHGLSCLITAHEGGRSRTLLFDTGPEDWVFERNVARLGADIGAIGAIVLSHGHWDHAGAMVRALQMIAERNGGRDVPAYMHPDMFYSRALKMPDGTMFRMEDVPGVEVLSAGHADVIVTTQEQSILGDSFYVSGEIPRVTAFERGLPGQHSLNSEGVWEPDELTKDERFVAVHVAGKGLVVFTACSHAGLINVLTEARRQFPEIPPLRSARRIPSRRRHGRRDPQTVEALASFGLELIAAAHCTGWRAIDALAAAYGDKVVPSTVGKRFTL